MQITASRRDDIIRRRDEYVAKANRNWEIKNEQESRLRAARKDVFSAAEKEIRRQLGDKVGELTIKVETRFDEHGLDVTISNENHGSPRRDPHASLTWTWRASLDKNGNVRKESSSWSGLEATTMEQVEDLKLCVTQLEIINTMDWAKILDVSVPRWEDYIDYSQLEDIGPKPDFDRELLEADIEELIGLNVLVKADEGRSSSGEVWYQILRDSGSQYTVREIPGYYVTAIQQGKVVSWLNDKITTIAGLVDAFKDYTSRIRKANFFYALHTPLETIEF